MARETGTVKWFSKEKGYGFITRASGDDIFVHHSDIEAEGFRTLRQGESVEFEARTADKGPRATHVRRDGGTAEANGSRRLKTPAKSRETAAMDDAGVSATPDGSLADQIRRRLGRFFGSG